LSDFTISPRWLLKYVVALCEEGNVTRLITKYCISPSSKTAPRASLGFHQDFPVTSSSDVAGTVRGRQSSIACDELLAFKSNEHGFAGRHLKLAKKIAVFVGYFTGGTFDYIKDIVVWMRVYARAFTRLKYHFPDSDLVVLEDFLGSYLGHSCLLE